MPRRLALWLTLPTGFAGLVYEVTWEQSLATLLGSHSEAAAAVLALFLGGLAAGYALFGRLARRRPEPAALLRAYGLVEIGIGVYALAFPELLSAARAVSARLPALADGPAFALDVALSALLIAPPATAMGATIPLLTQALPRDAGAATRIHARVYALNTLGATAGALAAAFWILPALGLSGAMRALAAVNLIAGGAYLAIARALPRRGPAAAPAAGTAREPAAAAAAALLLGFAMMTLQTSLLRLAALSLGGSPFTFAMVVAAFVLCIATGSAAVSLLRRVPAWLLLADVALLCAWLVAVYLPLDDGPYFGHRLRASFSGGADSFYPYQAAVFAGLLAVIGPAALLSGASLPLLFDRLRRERGDVGGVAGRLYAWNTVGSVAGALIGGYALFWWLDLHQVYRIAVGAAAVAGVLLAFDRIRPRPLRVPALLLPAALLLLPPWSAERLSSGAYRIRHPTPMTRVSAGAFFASLTPSTLLFHDDDPSASITVKEFINGAEQTDRNLVTNGKSEGSVRSEYATMAMLGLLPALFARKSERAFVIGLGTGTTVAELAALSDMREVVVAEISPAVIAAAPLFDALNGGGRRSDRVRVVRSDAYRLLLRSRETFDVIVSEPSNPWVAGVEMLFSAEFLEEGRRRLSPGGVYVQWLQLYETDPETLALVLRTLASVFEHVSVWYGVGQDLLLLGYRDADTALDLERVARRAARADFAAGLARAGIHDLPALLAHELMPVGAVHALALEGPLHTLAHPRLRHVAARAFHAGFRTLTPALVAPGPAQVAHEHSLWRRWQRGRAAPPSEEEWKSFASETCLHQLRECAAVLAAWSHARPDSVAPAALRLRAAARAAARGEPGPELMVVRALSRLFDEEVMLAEGGTGVIQASDATRLFAEHYHPAVPFSRSGIAARWRRCEAEPERRDECTRARRALESALGPLGVEP